MEDRSDIEELPMSGMTPFEREQAIRTISRVTTDKLRRLQAHREPFVNDDEDATTGK